MIGADDPCGQRPSNLVSSWSDTLARRPCLIEMLRTDATRARVTRALRAVADTSGPSQTASATRGAVVQRLLAERGGVGGELRHERDVDGSGCDLIHRGSGGLTVLAHLDEISYLVGATAREADGWPVIPFCYHLAEQPVEAAVVRYTAADGYAVPGRGTLHGPPEAVRFEPHTDIELQPGDRLVLPSAIRIDPETQRVTGSLDNAAGVAAAIVAAEVLAELDVPFTLVLTDEEEGPAGASSQTIARGAARLVDRLERAPVTAVVDIHGLSAADRAQVDDHHRSYGASLAEYSSAGRGAVTPPPLFAAVRSLFDGAADAEVTVTTNVGGHVPRSDDVVATLRTSAVCLLGFPGDNRHFDRGLPTANLDDIVALARGLIVLATATAAATGALAVENLS